MKDGYLTTADIRNHIIGMVHDGLVLVGNTNTKGHDLRYIKLAYHATMNGEEVLVLEMENFVPYVDAEPPELIREELDTANKRSVE